MNEKIVSQHKQLSYELEELVPIVAALADKYNGMDSSSISYEKANELMGAVIFCIQQKSRIHSEKMSAREAYERGFKLVEEKTKDTLSLYHQLLMDFDSYGNYYLKQTVVAGMPEFFKWYDIRFAPQEILLTLDYNVLWDNEIRKLQGIDAIYAYLKCIDAEQKFLGGLNRSFVMQCLNSYDSAYKHMVDNLCLPILEHFLGCVLLEARSMAETLTVAERKKIYEKLIQSNVDEMEQEMQIWLEHFIEGHYDESESKNIYQYLSVAVRDVLVRMMHANTSET